MSNEYSTALAAVLANRDTIYKAAWSKGGERLTDEHNAMCVELRPSLPAHALREIEAKAVSLAGRLKEEA
jgi:hypothetical protein